MSARLTPAVNPKDHSQGPAEAPVTLVEFGDFECPHCGLAYPVVKAVQRRLGDQMRLVFRHFPQNAVHPRAEPAAEVAELAGQQRKFWEMHDLLFEHQDALQPEDLVRYAAQLGLDARWTQAALLNHTFSTSVREDFLSGARSGVTGTPAFFINGVLHEGAWDEETLTEAVRSAALEAARR